MTNNRIGLTFLVIDDHEAILAGTVPALQEQYPGANIFKARDRLGAEQIIDRESPDLVMVDTILEAQGKKS